MKELLDTMNTGKILAFAFAALEVSRELQANPSIPASWKPTLVTIATVAMVVTSLFVEVKKPTANVRTESDTPYNPLKDEIASGNIEPVVTAEAPADLSGKMNMEQEALNGVVLRVLANHESLGNALTAEAVSLLSKKITDELKRVKL